MIVFLKIHLLISFFLPSQGENNKFLGTWEWKSEQEAMRIVLKRDPNFKGPDGKTYDVILGKHLYSKEGKTVEESLSRSEKDFVLLGVPSNNDTMTMSFTDVTQQKGGKVTLSLVANNQLQWKLKNATETITINRKTPWPSGFIVPTDMILTRVE